MKGYHAIVAIVFLLSGCGSDRKNISKDLDVFKIDSRSPVEIVVNKDVEVEDSYDYSQAFDSVSFVRLSNEPEAMVTNIEQLLVNDSLIFVLDRYGSGTVKMFSMSGQYLGDVGRRGRGPGEYIEPTHMELNGDRIIIWDQFSQQLMYYGMDRAFLGTKQFSTMAMHFHQVDSNRIIFNSVNSDNKRWMEDYSLFLCDSLSNVTGLGFYRKKNSYSNLWYNHDFFYQDSILYYHPVYCDTIYTVNSDLGAKAAFHIDFGSRSLPDKIRRHHNQEMKEREQDRYSFLNGDFFIAGDYLMFQYNKVHTQYTGLFSMNTGRLITFHTYSLELKKFFPLFLDNISTSTNNAFVGFFFPAFIHKLTSRYPIEQREELVEALGKERTDLVYSMKNDDNPIITFFYPSL